MGGGGGAGPVTLYLFYLRGLDVLHASAMSADMHQEVSDVVVEMKRWRVPLLGSANDRSVVNKQVDVISGEVRLEKDHSFECGDSLEFVDWSRGF